jgi:hypothetical protein
MYLTANRLPESAGLGDRNTRREPEIGTLIDRQVVCSNVFSSRGRMAQGRMCTVNLSKKSREALEA